MERYNTEVKRNEDGLFVKGTAPGPGRPKGKSLKEFWRQRFADMTDEEKQEFSKKVTPELLFRMAEGNPAQDNNHEIRGELIVQLAPEIIKKNETNESSE